MKLLIIIFTTLLAFVVLFLYSACVVSSRISREEELISTK